jgi:hypothetical protein
MWEPAKIERKALLTVVMDSVESIERVEVKSITLVPAQRTGLHLHPCTVVGYIPEGTISFQIEGQPVKVLKQGDAFHEANGARIVSFGHCIGNRAPRLARRAPTLSVRRAVPTG